MFRSTHLCLLLASASLALTLHAGSPLRLAEIAANRFVQPAAGDTRLQRGLLNSLGAFRVVDEDPVLVSVTVPPEAINKLLIQPEAWSAYGRLGPEALINFVADPGSTPYVVGARAYIEVSTNPDPRLAEGRLINISTRGHVSGTQKLIGGFVVDEQHRWVLLRAVGPGLAAFGVPGAIGDPYLTLYKGTMPIYFNGNWSTRPDAGDIERVGSIVGAFPLAPGSKDSALLVQLPPGTYTAHVEPESGEGGEVLLEVYSVPDVS